MSRGGASRGGASCVSHGGASNVSHGGASNVSRGGASGVSRVEWHERRLCSGRAPVESIHRARPGRAQHFLDALLEG